MSVKCISSVFVYSDFNDFKQCIRILHCIYTVSIVIPELSLILTPTRCKGHYLSLV